MFLRKLTIQRYRGIEYLDWCPALGLNCLIGPGDAGKTTVLAAIGLLLDPRSPGQASEFDYHRRRVKDGFEISAVLGAVEDAVSALNVPVLQGWKDGKVEGLPGENGAEPVLVTRVIADPELEITHSLLTPSGEPLPCRGSFRETLALARIGGASQPYGEFRLGRGSVVERHLGDVDVRAQITGALAKASEYLELPDETTKRLNAIGALFEASGLPKELALGIVPPAGATLMHTLALMTGAGAAQAIPLGFAGRGTRQMATYVLAVALAKTSPVVLLDEPEAGLEPYRQRRLVQELRNVVSASGQAFLTTHSPAVVSAMRPEELWHLRAGGNPSSLDGEGMQRLLAEAPDALLSRLPVLCEGKTEVGFLDTTLNTLLGGDGSLDARGIRLVDGSGQPKLFGPAQALLTAGVRCGVFIDNEEEHRGRRDKLSQDGLCAYGCWETVRNLEEAVAMWLPWDRLSTLLELAGRLNSKTVESYLQAVSATLGKQGRDPLDGLRSTYGDDSVRREIGAVAHEGGWFKNVERGRELGAALMEWGLPSEIRTVLEKFIEVVLARAG